MEDYYNKMQQRFLATSQYPQQNSYPPTYQNYQNFQPPPQQNQNENLENSNFSFNPPVQRPIEKFDGIIEPNSTGNQGHYGFNNNERSNGGFCDEIKRYIDEEFSSTARTLTVITCIVWIIIIILIFQKNV